MNKKKIRNIIISAVILLVAGYAAYMCLHYFFYREYKQCLAEYTFEPGTEFQPLSEASPSVTGMVLAAENDVLKLYTNLKTTEIAVYDKRSGETVYSNPPDRNEDSIATGLNKTGLNSQFVVTYLDHMLTSTTMHNFDYSVEREQFKVESVDNGLRYIYLLGDLTSPTGLVPPLITAERLEEKVLSLLEEKDAKTIRNSYVDSADHPGFLELTQGSRNNRVGLSKMNRLFEQVGYTVADFDIDAAAAEGGEPLVRTTFTVALEYRLVGDQLEVTVPTSQIVETGSGKITSITLLPYFGAGGMNEQGYLLVPNGSGSLIHFNNGKKTERYNQYIYGIDETAQSYTSIEKTEKARIPVFGIKREKSALLAEISQGDTLANLIAMVSGNINSYNFVYPVFTLRGTDIVSMFGVEGVSADLPVVEEKMYQLDLMVSYGFLQQQDASYSGMANYYRNQLLQRGQLTRQEASQELPFYLDIIGSVKRKESFLGAPYMGVYPMTRFDQAQEMVEMFRQNGVTNLRVNYLGWFNGGYYHDVAKNIKVDRSLGGKRDLRRLDEDLTASGSRLYGDVAFQRVSFESDHYNWKMETAQYYSGYVVALGRTNPATLRTSSMTYHEVMYDVLSPKFLVRHVNRFVNKFDNAGIQGVSLRDLGDMVPSDKRRNNVINREQSRQIILAQLKKLDEASEHMLINGGNAYTWPYARDLSNIPAEHNPFYIVDEEIPFYQMVIHGCIDYTGSAVNLSDSYAKQQILLRMLEYGLAPHFTLSWQDSSEMKYTGLNVFYTTRVDTWLEDASELYKQANEVLRHVSGSTISTHDILGKGVKRIRYDNGCILYINTGETPANHDGITIPARGYVLEGVQQ